MDTSSVVFGILMIITDQIKSKSTQYNTIRLKIETEQACNRVEYFLTGFWPLTLAFDMSIRTDREYDFYILSTRNVFFHMNIDIKKLWATAGKKSVHAKYSTHCLKYWKAMKTLKNALFITFWGGRESVNARDGHGNERYWIARSVF